MGLTIAELYARRVGGYERWSYPLRKIQFSELDRLRVWNRRFYDDKRRYFRQWPIPIELFDAEKPAPRYLFKTNLFIARHGNKLDPVAPGEKVYWSSNSWGFRGPEFRVKKSEGVVRIICLGASTTEGSQGNQETYPYFLQRELDRLFPGSRIEVINAGHAGSNIDDLQELLRQRVFPLGPDIILFYESSNNIGWNEFTKDPPLRCFHECWLQQYPLLYRFFYKHFALFNVLADRSGRGRRQLIRLQHTMDESLSKPSATHYKEVLSEMVRETQAHRSIMVLTSFITVAHEGLEVSPQENPLLADEIRWKFYPLTPGEVARVYDLFNQQSAAVAREAGVPYFDVASEFPKDIRYFPFDYIHLSPDGNRLLAERFARFLAKEILPLQKQ